MAIIPVLVIRVSPLWVLFSPFSVAWIPWFSRILICVLGMAGFHCHPMVLDYLGLMGRRFSGRLNVSNRGDLGLTGPPAVLPFLCPCLFAGSGFHCHPRVLECLFFTPSLLQFFK